MSEEISAEEKVRLLEQYKTAGDKALRNTLVMAYMNIVRFAAVSTRNMYAKYAETEDIINEATLALMAAIDSFDTAKNVKFETYASIKVRGAIIDYIRRQDIVPRNVRRFARDYDKAYAELYTRLDREPTEDELADYMQLPRSKFDTNLAKAASAQTLSFEDMVFNNNFDMSDETSEDGVWAAEASIHREEKMKYLAAAIKSLKEREQLVITLYYYEKLKFSDIGKVLDISESRVCQIHAQAVAKMKRYMSEYLTSETV